MTDILNIPFPIPTFRQRLLDWFDHYGRHDLPWQHPRTPYRVWLSEIMLQQTQVAAVIPYFLRFTESFPTVEALAKAPEDDVMAHWAGLGYYARARNLHRAAKVVANELNGQFPENQAGLEELPGVGRSTAGAILAQSFAIPAPILDGNVKRVLSRLCGLQQWPGQPAVERQLWQLAENLTSPDRPVDYTQGIMDLGATLCRRSSPSCLECPFQDGCVAHNKGLTGEIPVAKPRKKIPTHHRYLLVISNDQGEVYLVRRAGSGIWGGLWSLPESELNATEGHAKQGWSREFPALADEILNAREASAIKHSFSHYHLQLYPFLVRLQNRMFSPVAAGVAENESVMYAPGSSQELGLPAPIQKWLSKHFNH